MFAEGWPQFYRVVMKTNTFFAEATEFHSAEEETLNHAIKL